MGANQLRSIAPPTLHKAPGGGGAGNRLKGGGGLPPPHCPDSIPQRHSHPPTPAPTAFPTARNRPPTAFTSPVTALQPLWDWPDGPPPLQAKPWGGGGYHSGVAEGRADQGPEGGRQRGVAAGDAGEAEGCSEPRRAVPHRRCGSWLWASSRSVARAALRSDYRRDCAPRRVAHELLPWASTAVSRRFPSNCTRTAHGIAERVGAVGRRVQQLLEGRPLRTTEGPHGTHGHTR